MPVVLTRLGPLVLLTGLCVSPLWNARPSEPSYGRVTASMTAREDDPQRRTESLWWMPPAPHGATRCVAITPWGPAGQVSELQLTCDTPTAVEGWRQPTVVPVGPHAGLSSVSPPEVPAADLQPLPREQPRRRVFWLPQVTSWSGGDVDRQPVAAAEVLRLRELSLYWDEDVPLVSQSERWLHDAARRIVQARCQVEQRLGRIEDVDGDGRLSVLITPRVRQLTSMSPALEAFVQAADFQPAGSPPWSNACDLLVLAPAIADEHLDALLVHELAHAAQFSACLRQSPGQPWDAPDWLTEGLAHALECRFAGVTSNLNDRLAAFARQPHQAALVVNDSRAARLWREPRSRGVQAAFWTWCLSRFGDDWLRDWPRLTDPNGPGWQQVFGRTFADIHAEWVTTVAMHGIPRAGELVSVHRVELPWRTPLSVAVRGQATLLVNLPGDGPLELTVSTAARCDVGVVLIQTPCGRSPMTAIDPEPPKVAVRP